MLAAAQEPPSGAPAMPLPSQLFHEEPPGPGAEGGMDDGPEIDAASPSAVAGSAASEPAPGAGAGAGMAAATAKQSRRGHRSTGAQQDARRRAFEARLEEAACLSSLRVFGSFDPTPSWRRHSGDDLLYCRGALGRKKMAAVKKILIVLFRGGGYPRRPSSKF